ncbi:Fur family transcriptional regulator [Rhodovulum sulfidophilum]|uniref:Fur family transcriptional regulator n=1 Tax=Rhodovulum sulfidophilum TaxID=35806 RepID=UPI001913EC51|nr:transcriptional repressor [Rhodovulum sulfidophilum]MBK5925608.1 Fur family transcriptional regulator [Rhodovulum sulfidophilum]
MKAVGTVGHDREASTAERLASAESFCAENRLRFTAARRRVFEILLDEQKALGAYDILERLDADGLGSQPPIAYRALDFLVKHGFVRRIERLSAYVACLQPRETHDPAVMICRICDSVEETTSAPSRGMLGAAARDAGFLIEQTVVEAIGVCANCRAAGAV